MNKQTTARYFYNYYYISFYAFELWEEIFIASYYLAYGRYKETMSLQI